MGGPVLAGGGSVVDTALDSRPDAITFTTEPLERDVEVLGKPTVELDHTTDNPNVDLFVRISEVDSRGCSRNVTEVYKRLDPALTADPGRVVLHLRDSAHVFRRGNRVRLILAGGSFPQFARNLGTGENPGTGATMRPATHTIHHWGARASRLVLPVASSES
jgi:putative CocE/NonD family hydrolase